ncbi:MAG: hypothetical protein RIF33_22555 [Cyclobacteriaceae bacterium]
MIRLISIGLVGVVLAMSGCLNYYVSSSNRRLIEIPTVGHDRTVDIYLQSEIPKEDYIKIEVLEQKALESESTADLIYSLGQEAGRRGYDGIILQDEMLSTIIEDDESFLETVSEIITGEGIPDNYFRGTIRYLTAVGIIYKGNLTYLDKLSKAEQLLDPYGNLLATISFDYRGQIDSKSQRLDRKEGLYLSNFYQYSPVHLLKEESDHWKYKQEGDYIVKRVYSKNATRNKACYFEYDSEHRISQATIKNTYPQRLTEVVYFTYDEEGRLAEQRIVSQHRTRMIDFHYVNDRLLSRQIWEVSGEEKKLLYQTNIIHYDSQDIDSLKQLVTATRH